MKTVLQQAIETIQSSLKSYEEILTNEPYNAFIAGRCAEKQGVIDYLTGLLPPEKEQIVEANHCGQIHGEANGGNSIDVAQEYYQETYKS